MFDLFRTRHSAWCDLTDVEIQRDVDGSGIKRDVWHVVISTADSQRLPVEGVDPGTAETGGALGLLRAQLLALRDREQPPSWTDHLPP